LLKNIKNDNNALLFANLILKYSDKVQSKDIEKMYYKTILYVIKSQLATVRILAIENLELDVDNFDDHKKSLLN
jgi:glutaminyl-tRNA synthetase